jgi:DNA-directed RNA polymerase subunit RPC12/RpoP
MTHPQTIAGDQSPHQKNPRRQISDLLTASVVVRYVFWVLVCCVLGLDDERLFVQYENMEYQCVRCGSGKFYEDDNGYYNCSICGTQSQEYFAESNELEQAGFLFHLNLVNNL